MRLLVATPLYPPELGGPATYAKTLEDGLPSLEVSVDIVKFSDVRRLPKLVRHVAYFLKVLKAGKDADCILALDPVSVGLPAATAAGILGKPYFVKVVGDYAWEQGVQRYGITSSLDAFVQEKHVPAPVARFRKIQTRVARSAHAVIVPSEYLKSIVESWGIAREKIAVVYNAVEIPAAITGSAGAGDANPAHAQGHTPYTIVTAGRLVPWKGMRGVIDAFAALQTRFPDATLGIAGEGPERAQLEAYAKSRASGGITFLGTQEHGQLLRIIRNADVFVLNSEYEGLSHVLIEALLLGMPIVASKAGGNGEVIKDEENGLLVPVGDMDALTAAIARILSDKAFAGRLGEGARASRGRFTVEAMLSKTKALLV